MARKTGILFPRGALSRYVSLNSEIAKPDPNSLIITQNGEAKAIIQDIESYEQNLETMALLKILALGNQQLALGNQQIEKGKVKSVSEVFKNLRNRNRESDAI
ncbi:MAG: type II toxin-antitoxin system Phd/YefM family antitoxin [Proteobacteria bacterium]|nr:type II toxin-antitoxin system Phd/YefM family antitoxin [Pseudomonadota bacterium]